MRGNVNYIIKIERLGGLNIGELTTSLEAIFTISDTWAEMTSKGTKAIFEAEMVTDKE